MAFGRVDHGSRKRLGQPALLAARPTDALRLECLHDPGFPAAGGLFEADAFARWSGCRLPTEFEWETATESLTLVPRDNGETAELLTTLSLRGDEKPTVLRAAAANLLEAGALHPVPASPLPGLQQMFGDVWEWTSSPYTGYPGYQPLPGALGEYNGKFMSSQIILRGGSCVTPATHIRPTYRNFFPPSMRWQFCGLRLARDGARNGQIGARKKA